MTKSPWRSDMWAGSRSQVAARPASGRREKSAPIARSQMTLRSPGSTSAPDEHEHEAEEENDAQR